MPDASSCDLAILIPCNSRPRHLSLVLAGIAQARLPVAGFRGEVIVRHTGADSAIGDVVRRFQAQPPFAAAAGNSAPWRLIYDHQPVDSGNRSENRNAAIRQSTGERLVFLDADCIPTRNFLTGHWQRLTPGSFVCGGALRLEEAFSEALTLERLAAEDPGRWIAGPLQGELDARRARVMRHLRKPTMHKIPLQGGNFACWRQDMLAINGFDRHYAGWGQEDTDIGTRLFLLGRTPVNGVGDATALHIWHPPLDRPAQWKEGGNVGYFMRPGRMVRCRYGLQDRAPSDIRVAIDGGPNRVETQALETIFKHADYGLTEDRARADWVVKSSSTATAPKTTPRQVGIGLAGAPPGALQRWLGGKGGYRGASWWFIAGADPEATRAAAPAQVRSQIGGTVAAIGSESWAAALQGWLQTVG